MERVIETHFQFKAAGTAFRNIDPESTQDDTVCASAKVQYGMYHHLSLMIIVLLVFFLTVVCFHPDPAQRNRGVSYAELIY